MWRSIGCRSRQTVRSWTCRYRGGERVMVLEGNAVGSGPEASSATREASSFLEPGALDQMARLAIENARPVHVDLVEDLPDLVEVLRLRQRAVVEQGWAPDDPLALGLECDAYDDRASHVAAWDGTTVVGTVRIVVPDDGVLLPTEQAFGMVAEPRGRLVDWGRLVVDPGHRDPGHVVMLALLGRAWLATRAWGAAGCIGVASPAILELYRSLGIEASILAGPRLHWGEERYAARLLGVEADADEKMGLTGRGTNRACEVPPA